jgi:hypothetical protein
MWSGDLETDDAPVDVLAEPHPARLAPDHPSRARIMAAHRAALLAGRPGYSDPDTGLFVLTAATLASQGSCCHNGCRHCPYLRRPGA